MRKQFTQQVSEIMSLERLAHKVGPMPLKEQIIVNFVFLE